MIFKLKLLLCIPIFLNFVENVIVLTKNGAVRGKLVHSHGVYYYSFQGIPYAESPIGNLRFMPPVTKKKWSYVLNATKEGPVCPQDEKRYKKWQMSEDCLYLNIYVPATNGKEKLSVLAFIHGGGFKFLSGNSDLLYGPQMYLQRNIIFITMNSRLGALGYLSLGTTAAGNAGLKDVLLALRWIKRNIDRFGGDPNRITVGGHSSGAAVVHFLLLTTKSSGLFQRALLISGSSLTYRYLTRNPKPITHLLAERLALPTNNTNILLQMLRKVDAFDIVKAQENLIKIALRKYTIYAPFIPCIEMEHSNAFITREPLEIIRSGIPQNVPILTGINSREGIYIMKDFNITNAPLENLDVIIPHDIQYPRYSDERRNLNKSIKDFYFESNSSINNTYSFIALMGDTQYTSNVDYWIKIHKQNKNSNKVYYYKWDIDDDLNWAKLRYNLKFDGAAHADELGYMFVTKATKGKLNKMNARCKRMVDLVMTYFTNFIKFGDPTPDGQNISMKWPDCGKERSHFLLSEQPKSIPYAPFADRFQFWSDVYEQYYQYVENGRPLEIIVV